MEIRSNEDLIKFIEQYERPKFVFFWGHQKAKSGVSKSCLSQWFPSRFEENDVCFATAEHYMMYHKALLFNNHKISEQILKSNHPREAKKLGREVTGFDNEAWNEKRFEIVVTANKLKFSQNHELRSFLISTETSVLVEASPVDKVWGIGLAEDSDFANEPQMWKGQNLLGYALMEVRAWLAQNA